MDRGTDPWGSAAEQQYVMVLCSSRALNYYVSQQGVHLALNLQLKQKHFSL